MLCCTAACKKHQTGCRHLQQEPLILVDKKFYPALHLLRFGLLFHHSFKTLEIHHYPGALPVDLQWFIVRLQWQLDLQFYCFYQV